MVQRDGNGWAQCTSRQALFYMFLNPTASDSDRTYNAVGDLYIDSEICQDSEMSSATKDDVTI